MAPPLRRPRRLFADAYQRRAGELIVATVTASVDSLAAPGVREHDLAAEVLDGEELSPVDTLGAGAVLVRKLIADVETHYNVPPETVLAGLGLCVATDRGR